MSSARSASVRGFNPLRPKSLATYRVLWVGSLRTFDYRPLSSVHIHGDDLVAPVVLWLAGILGVVCGFAALWAGV